MTRAAISFHRSEMTRPFFLVILRVLLRTREAVLFVHPRDHANRSLRPQMKLLNQIRRFHLYSDARAVIDRARSQIPGIEMTRSDYDLLGVFAALDIVNHVLALDIR